jgi:hypothetical protein
MFFYGQWTFVQNFLFFLQSLFVIMQNLHIFAVENKKVSFHEKQKYPNAPCLPKDWLVPPALAHSYTHYQTDSLWC